MDTGVTLKRTVCVWAGEEEEAKSPQWNGDGTAMTSNQPPFVRPSLPRFLLSYVIFLAKSLVMRLLLLHILKLGISRPSIHQSGAYNVNRQS